MRVPDLSAEHALALQAGAAVVIPQRHGYEVAAGGLVGVVSVEGLQLRVTPAAWAEREALR